MSQEKNKTIQTVTSTRKDLKKRRLKDEFKRGTVKSKLIVIFTLFITQTLLLVYLFFTVQQDMVKAGLPPFNWRMTLSLVLLISIITLFFYLRSTMTRNLLFPLRRMVERMVELTDSLANGHGNFTTRIDIYKKDEIGELRSYYNRLLELLQKMLQKVKKSSHDVYDLTEDIKTGSEELAGHTQEQTTSIFETTSTLEQFTQVVKDNNRHADEVGTSIHTFNQQIQANRSLIDQVTNTMQEIDESSRKIDNIIMVINDISFQTNLLALNAAVEAARAGDAGRGFAVVAAEVRNLAQKTAESSRVIQEIVTHNVESSRKGMELAKANSQFFSSIIQVMQGIEEKIGKITDGSRQQTQGIGDINSTIDRLEKIITRNASLVQSFTATAQQMQASSSELMVMVDNFQVD